MLRVDALHRRRYHMRVYHGATFVHSPPDLNPNLHHITIEDDSLSDELRSSLSRLIAYAKSADPVLQGKVAERLANEAVKREAKMT